MPTILLAIKHAQQDEENTRQMIRIAQETATTPTDNSAPKGATAGGDERKLRGIPAISRGVTGAIPGTTPHAIR